MANGTIKSTLPTEFTDNTETTQNSRITKSYTVSGNGFVMVTASIMTDTTSDVGSMSAYVLRNNEYIAYDANRLTVAASEKLGASVTVAVKVINGDVLTISLAATKNGSKNLFRRFLCFGCSVS